MKVGPGATGVKTGDRVAVYLAIGCGHCQWCHSGFRMLCPEFKCLGFDLDGAALLLTTQDQATQTIAGVADYGGSLDVILDDAP